MSFQNLCRHEHWVLVSFANNVFRINKQRHALLCIEPYAINTSSLTRRARTLYKQVHIFKPARINICCPPITVPKVRNILFYFGETFVETCLGVRQASADTEYLCLYTSTTKLGAHYRSYVSHLLQCSSFEKLETWLTGVCPLAVKTWQSRPLVAKLTVLFVER